VLCHEPRNEENFFCWLDVYTIYYFPYFLHDASCSFEAASDGDLDYIGPRQVSKQKKKVISRYFSPVFERINLIGHDVSLTRDEQEAIVFASSQCRLHQG
jgi:hypothetical protein